MRSDVLDLFTEKLAPAGFKSEAFLPSYGMAESTLAISFADVSRPFRVDTVDRTYIKLARRAVPANARIRNNPDKVRSFVVCGKPMPGHTVEVRDGEGRSLGDREIGGIVIKGPSLMAGYFQNEAATAEVIGADGFLDTGDMGYWLDGEIVITGRAKDLILHNGRNIWPQDIEWAAEVIPPLKSGDVAAFAVEGLDGDDEVVVLVECKLAHRDQQETLRKAVHMKVHQVAGVDCVIVLVPPRSLPFTSSGKLSRAGARDRYLAGEIAEISPDTSLA